MNLISLPQCGQVIKSCGSFMKSVTLHPIALAILSISSKVIRGLFIVLLSAGCMTPSFCASSLMVVPCSFATVLILLAKLLISLYVILNADAKVRNYIQLCYKYAYFINFFNVFGYKC